MNNRPHPPAKKTSPTAPRRKSRLKIRGKIYLAFLLILVFNILATMFFGETLFEKLYTFDKNSELVAAQKAIKTSYLAQDGNLIDLMHETEKNNITVFLFTREPGDGTSGSSDTVTIEYFSRSFDIPTNQIKPTQDEFGKYNPLMWINSAVSKKIFSELDASSDKVIVANQDDFSMQPGNVTSNRSMLLYSKIGDNVYLFLETPREFITQTADLAVRYTLYISLLTLVIALFLVAVVSKRITKPVLNMETVANKIANLDFSDRCRVESGDELGHLGSSINRMSETLQENIQRLTVMNAMLREDLAREEQTNRMRREFIANVSHDFKTPLSLITAYCESIRDQEQNAEERDRQCDIIISESNKMDRLVNQLLKLSQLENKMVALQESMFDLTGTVEEVVYSHQILLKAKNIRVEFMDRTERIAFGDFGKIEQVLSNLFENAIKYTEDDGIIKIWITRGEKYVIHLYNDTKAVSEIDPDQLFASFYKNDRSRSLEDKSYGLGLAIVKAIVELHGGRCGAYKEEKGMVFWFEVGIYKEKDAGETGKDTGE